MAEFKCEKCGCSKEGRCQPKKCPECNAIGVMVKQEAKPAGCGCKCSCKSK